MPDADYDDFGSLHHVEGRNTQGGPKEDQKRTRGGIWGRFRHERVGDERRVRKHVYRGLAPTAKVWRPDGAFDGVWNAYWGTAPPAII